MMSKHDPQHLQDDLSAYLDGELDGARRAEVEAYLREDPQARRVLDELRQAARAVESLDRHDAPGDLVDTVLARMEREQLLGAADEQDYLDVASARPGYGRWVASAAMVFLTVSVGVIVFRQSQSPSEQAIVASRQPTSEAIKKEVNLEDLALAKADADREVADDAVLTPPLTEMAPGARTPLPSERESMIQRRLKSLGYTGSTRATAKVETPAPAVPQQIELKTAEAMEAAPAAPLPMRAEERAAELADVAKPPKPSAMPRLKAVPAELDDPQDPVVDQSLEITCPTESARLHHASMIEAFFAENDIEVIQAASESPVAEGSGKDTADPAAGETTYVAMIDPDQIRQLNAMLAASAAVDALAWSKQKSNQREEKTREAPVVADRLRVGGEGAHPSSAAAVQPPTDELTFSRDPKGSAPAAAAPKPNDQITPRVGAMRPADVTIDQPAQRARSDEKADRSTAQPPTKLRVQIRVISRPPVR